MEIDEVNKAQSKLNASTVKLDAAAALVNVSTDASDIVQLLKNMTAMQEQVITGIQQVNERLNKIEKKQEDQCACIIS